jgi:galactose mutarotase-like enzyme
MGFHPWFERPARVTANVDGVWTGDGIFPTRWAEFPGFRGFDVDHAEHDNTFTGWDGRAVIDLNGLRVDLSANASMLHVFTPRGQGYFAVEPTDAIPGAFGRPDLQSIDTVEPGASVERWMRLDAI